MTKCSAISSQTLPTISANNRSGSSCVTSCPNNYLLTQAGDFSTANFCVRKYSASCSCFLFHSCGRTGGFFSSRSRTHMPAINCRELLGYDCTVCARCLPGYFMVPDGSCQPPPSITVSLTKLATLTMCQLGVTDFNVTTDPGLSKLSLLLCCLFQFIPINASFHVSRDLTRQKRPW